MTTPHPTILIVCTANQCRSPMAEVLARAEFARSGVTASVGSAGTDASDGAPATDGALAAVRQLGLDLSGHRSRPVTADLARGADLTIVMERSHLLQLVNEHGRLDTTFTLPELAAFAAAEPDRAADETLGDWLGRISSGRDQLRALAAPEIADPIGRSNRHYRSTGSTIRDHLAVIVGAYRGDPADQ